jgi:hypothetical protein
MPSFHEPLSLARDADHTMIPNCDGICQEMGEEDDADKDERDVV